MEEYCMACHLCEVYCQLQGSGTADLLKAFGVGTAKPNAKLKIATHGNVALSIRCQQCWDAPCLDACLTGCLSRNQESGLIDIDEERCMGCWTCMLACPYGAIKQDRQRKKIIRCDLCQGEEEPACVRHCPNEALVYAEDVKRVLLESSPDKYRESLTVMLPDDEGCPNG